MSFADSLHPASWRGVPFGVEAESSTHGRRKAIHEYPYRDSVWVEDQGKRAPGFKIRGFLVGDSAIYGGGDLAGQRRQMEAAAEASGLGVLVHPTKGRLTVDLLDLVISSTWDEGNVVVLDFSFIQGGSQLFPAVLGAASGLLAGFASLADAAGLGAFVSAVIDPLERGLDAAASMATTAGEWLDRAKTLARDATSLYGTVSQLGGADYGRYFNGRNSGFLAGLSSPYAGATSVPQLIAAGSAQRARVATAADAVTAAIAALGVSAQPADIARAVQAAVAALQGCAADPADGVRILSTLARFSPAGPDAATPSGLAVGALFRQAAAVALARVAAAYEPASADDANAVRAAVLRPLDAEITAAGNSGGDAVFTALRVLRKGVVDDLGQRGGALARLVEIDLPTVLPDVVVAERQYGDAARAPELVTQANPIHPLFMPTAFRALAS